MKTASEQQLREFFRGAAERYRDRHIDLKTAEQLLDRHLQKVATELQLQPAPKR